MSKKQAAIRHMLKKVEERKVERFKAKMAAQHDRNNRLRAKEEENARMEKAMQKLQKEVRERTVNDYEMHFFEKNYKFNHEYGDLYDNKRNDGNRRFY